MNNLTSANPSAPRSMEPKPATSPSASPGSERIQHLFRHAMAGGGAHPLLPLILVFRASTQVVQDRHE